MSWVALLKAISQKKASEARNHMAIGNDRATPARAAPTSTSIANIHQRFVRSWSTMGLHRGLMTQGR